MTPDPHMAFWSREYRRARCMSRDCTELAPLAQDGRWRGVYCDSCRAELEREAERER